MTKVTIIIHEGHDGPHGRGRRQRPFGHEEGCGPRHGGHSPRHGHHGGREFGGEGGRGPRHGRHGEREFGHEGDHGEREFGRRHERGEGRGAFGERPPLSEAERRVARHVRHEVRRIMRAAEEAGLPPERVARLVRRQTRPDFD
ncbi:MAG: hypothetical protein KIT52_20215 [Anaerolineae bacterium]|nr:hypothetical protein [Anaerolineae bacterium]